MTGPKGGIVGCVAAGLRPPISRGRVVAAGLKSLVFGEVDVIRVAAMSILYGLVNQDGQKLSVEKRVFIVSSAS
jgi:hypothetical protein